MFSQSLELNVSLRVSLRSCGTPCTVHSPSLFEDCTAKNRLRRAPAGSPMRSLRMQPRAWSRRGTRLARSSVSYLAKGSKRYSTTRERGGGRQKGYEWACVFLCRGVGKRAQGCGTVELRGSVNVLVFPRLPVFVFSSVLGVIMISLLFFCLLSQGQGWGSFFFVE